MDDIGIVREKLIAYMTEMHEWETKHFNRLQEKKGDAIHLKQTFAEASEELSGIYQRHLTPKDRKYTSKDGSLKQPPEYDVDSEIIEECLQKNKNRIEIRTLHSEAVETENQYVFLKKNNEWLLDNKKTFWPHKDKWESTVI